MKEYLGIPLYAALRFSIPLGSQVIQIFRLQLEYPSKLHREIFSAPSLSPKEPSITPGILFSYRDEIQVRLENLTSNEILVSIHQLLGYICLEENKQMRALVLLDDLEGFGLLLDQTSFLTVIPCEKLSGLSEEQKDKALALFVNYQAAFAEDDLDIGKAIGVEHQLNAQGHEPTF